MNAVLIEGLRQLAANEHALRGRAAVLLSRVRRFLPAGTAEPWTEHVHQFETELHRLVQHGDPHRPILIWRGRDGLWRLVCASVPSPDDAAVWAASPSTGLRCWYCGLEDSDGPEREDLQPFVTLGGTRRGGMVHGHCKHQMEVVLRQASRATPRPAA